MERGGIHALLTAILKFAFVMTSSRGGEYPTLATFLTLKWLTSTSSASYLTIAVLTQAPNLTYKISSDSETPHLNTFDNFFRDLQHLFLYLCLTATF